MCGIEFYKDTYCGHRWARIVQPCWPGYGFTTCPTFFTGYAQPQPVCYIAREEPCPACDLRGVYDRNQIRMVVRLRSGFRLGMGPSRCDPGVEVRWCCAVM
ncbi:hypothetical protein B0T19DRAFT_43561 [Cercophora scortea]|uniref:Uncharacterized protein n=1 Tax=Cercophora scortea TaxID=314031 RepID=A0AAE0J4T6_9PEZI|nr:hypothetical protein B0T19DRAFT_43561 [Cercophora scortea]